MKGNDFAGEAVRMMYWGVIAIFVCGVMLGALGMWAVMR
jgi:hypothetical protein